MKIEKIYADITSYVQTMEAAEQAAVNDILTGKSTGVLIPHLKMLADAIKGCREIMAESSARSSGRRGILSAVKRILKVAAVDWCKAPWLGNDGRQYFCSGYHAVALTKPVEGLGEVPEEDMERAHNIEGIVDMLDADMVEVPLPDVAHVKAHIKLAKAKYPAKDKIKRSDAMMWDLGPEYRVVNSQYLLDVMEALPGSRAYVQKNEMFTPIFFITDDGSSGILCPVKPKDGVQRCNTDDLYNDDFGKANDAKPCDTPTAPDETAKPGYEAHTANDAKPQEDESRKANETEQVDRAANFIRFTGIARPSFGEYMGAVILSTPAGYAAYTDGKVVDKLDPLHVQENTSFDDWHVLGKVENIGNVPELRAWLVRKANETDPDPTPDPDGDHHKANDIDGENPVESGTANETEEEVTTMKKNFQSVRPGRA